MRISANGAFAYVDYIIAIKCSAVRKEALAYSCYNRSEMELRSFGANISLGNTMLYLEEMEQKENIVVFPQMRVATYLTGLVKGKEPLFHSVSWSQSIGGKYVLTTRDRRNEDIYNWLMSSFGLPLLAAWVPYLLQAGKEEMKETETVVYGRRQEWMQGIIVYEMSLTEESLQEMVANGLKKQEIHIARIPQKPLQFSNMDDYFVKYGGSLIKNLEQKLNPLVDLKETVDEIAFLEKRLYPQQAAIVNGLIECMRHSSYAFLNEDMGCGKTLQCLGVLEGFFNRMVMKETGKSIRDIYLDSKAVKYRIIIMCPPHLVKKWEEAIWADIPYAKVTIIRGLKELCRLRKRGRKRTCKEFYILSKETGKLSYTYVPLPSQVKCRNAAAVVCKKCREIRPVSMPKKCICGCEEWEIKDYGFKQKGMVCPECGLLLYNADIERYIPESRTSPLMPIDFASQTKANRICRHCGTQLWQPACEPVNKTFSFKPVRARKKKWVRMTHWANMAKKCKKSAWVHEEWKQEYIEKNKLSEDEITYPKVTGARKYAPSRYIRKYLKGFFDFSVFDEAHEYKGGGSAQGMAMHDLVKASKWQLALTGTIAGGYASHFFYILYRLDAAKMKAMGFSYTLSGEKKFVERYGTIATEYEISVNDRGSYNTMSRGRQLGTAKCRPGISPQIFTDFLLDKAVFLNLSDMSDFLPPLVEMVEYVPLESEIYDRYKSVRQKMKEAMHKEKMGKSILGSFLQFSLSYSDKPYGRGNILSPIDGNIIASVTDLGYLVSDNKLLNKEKRLCEIIVNEISEGRNTFVYCEYTGSGEANITHRLRQIIQENCGLKSSEVEILESSYPPAEEREEWMHERAAKGVRVFITNPRCVKTGLDFLFIHEGIMYNFPTIIFYQYNYDLFTMWQASRRHYRLNQVLECRTFYLLSERTIQIDALELVASKQVATSAIQGHFSSEGLCAMAHGIDPRIKLAQAVSEKSPEQLKNLKNMFSVLNQWHIGGKDSKQYEKMLTFQELTGIHCTERMEGLVMTETGENVDLFKYFGFGVSQKKEGEHIEFAKSVEEESQKELPFLAEKNNEIELEQEKQTGYSWIALFGGKEELGGLFQKNTKKKRTVSANMKSLF